MSYNDQQIAKQIASLLKSKQTPIFQKGTTSSTGINKELTVRLTNGKVVRALGWNVSTPGEVNVFWDAQNKRYVAWKEEASSLKRRTVLANRKTRPDEKKYLWEYFIKVLQPSSIEGFDADVVLDLTGYTPLGITNTGDGYIALLKNTNDIFNLITETTNTTFGLTITINNQKLQWVNNGIAFRFDTLNTISQRISTSNWGSLSTYRPTSFPNEEGFFANNIYGAIPYNLELNTVGTWVTDNTIYTSIHNDEVETGSGNCVNSRSYGYDDIYYRLFGSNGAVSQNIYYYSINGDMVNNYNQKIYATLSNAGLIETIGIENVDYSFSVNIEFYAPNGAYPLKRYRDGGIETMSSVTSLPATSVVFANPNDKIQRLTTSTVNNIFNEQSLLFSSQTDSSFVYIIPKIVGNNCSLYLKIEYETTIDANNTFTLDQYVAAIDGNTYDGYSYSLSTRSQIINFVKKSRVSEVVKINDNYHYLSDLNNNNYTFGSRFLIIGNGGVSLGDNTYVISDTDTYKDNNQEYSIGIRYECQEGYFTNKKWGAFESQTTKTLINGAPTSFYTVNPINFQGVIVDIFSIVGNGLSHHWKGVITGVTYENAVDIGFEDGNTYRKYDSFSISVVEDLGVSFFKWSNVNDTIGTTFIVPSDDFTISILKYLWDDIYSFEDCGGTKTDANLYIVLDENGNETVELAIAEIPTTTTPTTLRADIYRFNTTTLKWERRPNAITPVSPLTEVSDFVSYHPTASNSRKKRNRPPRS